jgi:hypothetical protein
LTAATLGTQERRTPGRLRALESADSSPQSLACETPYEASVAEPTTLTPQHEHDCTARIGEKIAEGAVMRVRHDKKAFVLSAVVASNPKALASGAAWTLVPADGEFFVRDATSTSPRL